MYHPVLFLPCDLPHSYMHAAADGECEVGFSNLSMPVRPQYAKKETQYIAAGMNFTCSGNITEWNIAASIPRNGPKWRFIALQLWRVQGTNVNGATSYSLVEQQVFSTTFKSSRSSTILTFSPTPEMSFSSGDVVGFHVHGKRSPLSVLLGSAASSFTMYEESQTRTAPAAVADVSSSFSTISAISPLISVVVRRESTLCIHSVAPVHRTLNAKHEIFMFDAY